LIAGHEILSIFNHANTGLDLQTPSTVFEDREGHYWIAVGANLYQYNEKQNKWKAIPITFEQSSPLYRIETINQTADGSLWLAASHPGFSGQLLSAIDRNGRRVAERPIDSGPEAFSLKSDVSFVFQGHGGREWVIFRSKSKSFLTCFDGVKWSASIELPVFVVGGGLSGCEDKDGGIWLGVNFEVWTLDRKNLKWTKWDKPPVLDSVHRTYEDRHGRLWFAGSEDFVAICDKDMNSTATYKFTDYLPSSAKVTNRILAPFLMNPTFSINSMYQDKSGQIMIATNRGLLVVANDEKRWSFVNLENTVLQSNLITTLFEDSAGRIWLGSSGGIVVLKP